MLITTKIDLVQYKKKVERQLACLPFSLILTLDDRDRIEAIYIDLIDVLDKRIAEEIEVTTEPV